MGNLDTFKRDKSSALVRDRALRIVGGHVHCPQTHKPAPKLNIRGLRGWNPRDQCECLSVRQVSCPAVGIGNLQVNTINRYGYFTDRKFRWAGY
jgi:hypothetical protein